MIILLFTNALKTSAHNCVGVGFAFQLSQEVKKYDIYARNNSVTSRSSAVHIIAN